MSRYIDADKLHEEVFDRSKFEQNPQTGDWVRQTTIRIGEVLYMIDEQPTVDVVEVVRCKDCKWWDGIECKTRDIDVVDVDDFCSYGERKDGDEHECE